MAGKLVRKDGARSLSSLSPRAALEALSWWRPTMRQLTTKERVQEVGEILTRGIFRALANQQERAREEEKGRPTTTVNAARASSLPG